MWIEVDLKLYINGEEVADSNDIQITAKSSPDQVSVVIDGDEDNNSLYMVDDAFELKLTKE